MLDAGTSLLIAVAISVGIGFFLGRIWIKKDLKDAEEEIVRLLLEKQ